MESIEKVQQFLQSLDGSIDELENKLQPIITQSLQEVIAPIEDPIERIEVYNNYSYVLVSIIYAYLKSTGTDLTNHPIMKELERVKTYNKRHKDLITEMANKESKDEEMKKSTRDFLTKTLGVKDDETAISKSNFQGVHKKFDS